MNNKKKPIEKPKSILEEANDIINGDRQSVYGSVTANFTRIASMWSAILGYDITPKEVGLCMVALKISREVNKANVDNLRDVAGYIGCIEKLNKGE